MNKITIDRATVEQALEALGIGREYAFETAEQFHIEMRGYKQQRHDAMDSDVAQIDASIASLRQTLQQPNEFHPDWDQIKPFNDRIAELEKVVRQALGALEGVVRAHGYKGGTPVEAITALRERLAQPEQTVSMTEYKRLQDLVTSQGIRLMEYESAQPEQVKFKCTVVDDDHPDGVPLSKWGRHPDQEPFCYYDGRNIVVKEFADHSDVFPLYTAPPPRQWHGLTEEEVKAIFDSVPTASCQSYDHWRSLVAHAIEAKLKERNT